MKIHIVAILSAVALLLVSCSGSRRSSRHETETVAVENLDSLTANVAARVMESLRCSVGLVIDSPRMRFSVPCRDTVGEVEFTARSVEIKSLSATDRSVQTETGISVARHDMVLAGSDTLTEKSVCTKFRLLPVIALASVIVICAVRVIKMFV